jgi:hypothetical protein
LATILRAKQGNYMRYRFRLFNPQSNNPTGIDPNNPFSTVGYRARFSFKAGGQTYIHETPPTVTVNGQDVTVFFPATATRSWAQGNLPFELDLIPPTGEEDRFSLVSGFIQVERRLG